ncbi:hypothetical protein E4U19_000020 [Claviceps sp. Clav32 group G5]|nr:hypothetical protein E4U19_000020 [Claviceps sp. Clav32 group G5]
MADIVASGPVSVSHRRSLSSVFKTVKIRYSRDRLDKNEAEWQSFVPPRVFQGSQPVAQDVPVFTPRPRNASPPPFLEMPSDLVARDLSAGLSTFRASLEKAVDDINNKYGTPSSMEACQSYVIHRGLEQNLPDGRGRSLPMPITFPLSNFRPRYQLPRLMDAPASKAKSTMGEVRNLSSTMSAESDPLEEAVAKKDDDESHIPILLLGEAVDSGFNLDELMPATASQTASKDTAPVSIAVENGQPCARHSLTCSSSRDSTHNPPEKHSNISHVEFSSNNSDSKSGGSASVKGNNDSTTASSTHENDCLSLAQNTPLPTHQRQRSYSERASCNIRESSIENYDRESLLSNSGIKVKRLRARSTPENSECASVIINSRLPSNTSDGFGFSDESIPSVSDLVRKFRRMGSMPGESPSTYHMDALKQNPAIRRISRGNQFESFRHRFPSDSEASSALSSCTPGYIDEEFRPRETPSTTAREVQRAA